MVITLGVQRLAEIRLKRERGCGGLPRLFPESDRGLQCLGQIAARIDKGEQRPGEGKLRVQPDGFSEILLRSARVSRCISRLEIISEAAQIGIVGFRILRRLRGDDLLFQAGQPGLQLVSDRFRHLTLDRKDVGQFAIKGISPKMRIIGCFDQLHVHPHLVATLLHAAFQDVGDAKLAARSPAGFPARFHNAASKCARSLSDRRSSRGGSGSRPGCRQQSRRWLCPRSGFRRVRPRCFFPRSASADLVGSAETTTKPATIAASTNSAAATCRPAHTGVMFLNGLEVCSAASDCQFRRRRD